MSFMKLNRLIYLVVLCALIAPSFAASTVRINEFLASNNNGLADEDGSFSDWVELHNFGTEPVSLDEWALTDDPAVLTKWEFPPTTIPAGGYVVVFASGKKPQFAETAYQFQPGGNG